MPTNHEFDARYDAVVVGARVAGAATAMLLARAGAKVLLVDRQAYGTDTASTHALMRSGVYLLDQWGLLPSVIAAGTPKITQTTFHYGPEQIGVDIKPEYGIDHLCAPRRTVLDRILVDAAVEAGADVRHGVSLSDLQFGTDGRVIGVKLHAGDGNEVEVLADIVVGADGRQSTVARLVHAQTYFNGISASAYVYGYYEGLAADGFHWYFEDQTAAGTIATNDRQHCVFVGVPHDQFVRTFKRDIQGGFMRMAAANSPDLAQSLSDAGLIGRLRGFVCSPGYFRRSHGPGWALVGDAGYFKDPLTAHGITDAFRDAERLAHAVQQGSDLALERYQAERDALSLELFDVTDEVASFEWDLNELKDKHIRLNKAMKAETAAVATSTDRMKLAA